MTLVVPGFTLLERLATVTRNSEVWLATDPLGASVALKVLVTREEFLAARLEAEARWLRRLGGTRHLVACRDFLPTPPTLVLEFAGSGTLLDRLYSNGADQTPVPIPIATAVRIVLEVADAIGWLHQNGVIHRDVKPSNVVLSEAGTATLVDLGVAASPGDPPNDWIEESIGSLGYAAPELLRDPSVASPAVDQYGLAATLYEAITGHLPFDFPEGQTEAEFRARVANGERPVPVAKRVPILGALGEVVDRGLAPSAGDRHPTIASFVEALRPFAESG